MLRRLLAGNSTHWQFRLITGPYSLLLVLLLGILIFAGLFPRPVADPLVSLTMTSIVAVTLQTLMVRRQRYLYLSMAFLALGLDFLYSLASRLDLPLKETFHFFIGFVWLLFIGLSIVLVAQSIFTRSNVTLDTVIGGICIFLMLGYFWFIIFGVLSLLNPNAVAGPNDTTDTFDLVYFSFTTLTTVGYGEFTPVTRMAKVAANLESIVGVLYPAIFIARLVNTYQQQNTEANR